MEELLLQQAEEALGAGTVDLLRPIRPAISPMDLQWERDTMMSSRSSRLRCLYWPMAASAIWFCRKHHCIGA